MILATGGTIGNTVDGRLPIEDLLADIERVHPYDHPRLYADLDVQEVLRIGAESFTPNEWQIVGRAVTEAVDSQDVDGVVVTHGTFTAEVTAYFLHLTVNTTKPIVVACSQRKHGTVGNDGDRNLIDAVRIASDPAAHGLGVVVVLNEEIHSARDVTKTSRRPSGFRSDHSGILGTVSEDGIFLYRRPSRRHTRDSEFLLPPGELPRVDIVATYAGADGTAVDAFRRAGARGLVVNGFSYSGKPHEHQRPSLERAVEDGVAVVLVNRGGDGRMPTSVEPDGFVRGDNLTAQKARVLLSVGLTTTNDLSELQRIFTEY
jgi:L-asparaginase